MIGGYDEHPWNTFDALIVVEMRLFPECSSGSRRSSSPTIYRSSRPARQTCADASRRVEARFEDPRVHRTDNDFAVAWAKMAAGESSMTLGHVEANWDKPEMQAMKTGAIKWARLADADVTPRRCHRRTQARAESRSTLSDPGLTGLTPV
jgi:hypothetical protein